MTPRNRHNPKSRFGAWALSATAIAGMMSPAAIVAPARAATLNAWTFDPASQAVALTLPNGITPDFFLLAEPARIVLEIPSTTLGTVMTVEQYGGAVRNIRLTEVAGGLRLVLELAPNTRLDPRHAQLMATDLGNGQTEWVLQPLLQDAPTAPIAASPVAPSTTQTSSGEVSSTPASQDAGEADTVPAIAEIPEPAAIVDEPEATALEDEEIPADIATGDEVAISPADESTAVALPVTPPALSATPSQPVEPLSASPSLPDIAASATTGAVQSLPTGPDPLADVSTEAGILAGAINDDLNDQPPSELPLDPFMNSGASTVSVPSLAEADSTPAPAVSVPPLATVPDAPSSAVPQPNQTASATTGTPNQVRPPTRSTAPTAPPTVATAPARRVSVAPPPNASSATTTGVAPNQVRPPSPQGRTAQPTSTAAALPPESTIRPPVATATRPEPLPVESAIRPPVATASRTETLPAESTIRPPVATAARTEALPPESTIRPPVVETARTEALPPESAIRPPVTATTPRPTRPDVIAANSLEIPTLPSPPDHWREPDSDAIAPGEVRPPSATITPSVPNTVTAPSEGVTTAAIETQAPPFLSPSAAESATPNEFPQSLEQPSIPPPPPIPRGSGPLPFGEPLPQSRP